MSTVLRRVLIASGIALSLLLAATATASASTGSAEPGLVRFDGDKASAPITAAATIAACPQPGQRVKTASDPRVYLVDPDYYLNHIPTEATYFALWDSWSGIGIVSQSTLVDCFGGYFTMSNAHLAKTGSSPAVYIYDVNGGGYRWITSAAVFNKYAFSWGKIRTQSSVSPVSSLLWDQ